ncbi:amino acid transporter [Anaerospora hongkongensis]|uniref:Amino acid transporter n=1 Tax=Anaerospora hongkongensis TaxID=244830 RepID=A0A4R1PYC9_9FIRM|nr:APC family permease [Anaerospora hongkongensis]TCL37801.1 amino acid transporter [Anaerospora hongkongensis]
MMRELRRVLIGRPLHNRELAHERLPKWKALSIFSSDALSSVAYGPEQIMLTLALPGLIAYGYMAPVAISILILLAIVTLSYAQVAKANPGGGGAYAIAKQNLGEKPALIAAGSVFADYILTAAVSVSAGTAAIISAFPELSGWEVPIDIVVLFGVLMLVNLRGVRESSNAFVLPTYAFLAGILLLLFVGLYRMAQAPYFIPPDSLARQQLDWSMLFLALRAFANGCSSMTGIEAIADSVPMFKSPESRNAAATTYWMAGILGFMFLGISALILHHHILPIIEVTALSQLAEQIFGRTPLYYYIQITTMLVLYLAANTAYNGLPVLLSIIARDGYMPRYLAQRGERLTFSNGIILLTIIAALLIVIYGGKIENLIALYAIGVFISFTIAQVSMVVHWRREKGAGWQLRVFLNGLGAAATGIVVAVITVTKFVYGAWLVLVFIPIMVTIFKRIRGHYNTMADQLHLPEECYAEGSAHFPQGKHLVIVPVASPTRIVYETIKYAKLIGDNIIAVHVASDDESEQKVRQKWQCWDPGVQLVVLRSPYRLLMRPLINFIEKKQREKGPDDFITVVIPEFETRKWWHRLLHNQTGWFLHTTLVLKENIAVTTVPFHLKR